MNTRLRSSNKTGYKGVFFGNSRFYVYYKGINVGSFLTYDEAVQYRKRFESGELEFNEKQEEAHLKKKEGKKRWDEEQRNKKSKLP